jgi:hypothetical protein
MSLLSLPSVSFFAVVFLVLTGGHADAQSGANSFPATGNASVGTSASPNTFTVNGTLTTNGVITQTGSAASASSGITTYMQANFTNLWSSTNLNPGLLVFQSGPYVYGMDLGYNAACNNYRTRIFAPSAGDIALSYQTSTAPPTSQSNFTDALVVVGLTGNVLIGKTTQANTNYKLDVVGQIRADKITVNTTGADFVFDSAYRLPALPEVASYIRANHHLIHIAPAADMERNGVDLGNNQISLLRKVEELTLYAIDADKEIRQLKALCAKQAAIAEAQQVLLLKLQARLEAN